MVPRELGWLGWRVIWLGLKKKHPKNKNGKNSATQKNWMCYNVGLTLG